MSQRLDDLLNELVASGFDVVHKEGDQAVIHSSETEATFVLTSAGDWVQAAQTLIDGEEMLEGVEERLAVLALRIQARFLGCRFAFDEDGTLDALTDIFPETSVEQVRVALAQLAYVAVATLPLFGEVGDAEISEQRIELALGHTFE